MSWLVVFAIICFACSALLLWSALTGNNDAEDFFGK
mgnify:CR=1 FL=1|tara:strand:+ start:210 stop:317 length:108 start_codon:yes stop_codon:yes gene_type:complete